MLAISLRAATAALFVLCGVNEVRAQETEPSDAELRSAYCISVLQASIGFEKQYIDSIDAASDQRPDGRDPNGYLQQTRREAVGRVSKMKSALQRLQAYLIPRMMSRNPVALVAATQRAQRDWADFNSLMERSTAQCPLSMSEDALRSCVASVDDKDLRMRLLACESPDWLPF